MPELIEQTKTISNGVSSMQNKLKQDSCGLYNHIRGINVSYGSVQRLTPKVHAFVEESVVLCQPEQIHICDGSDMEHKMLLKHMLEAGTIVPLPKYENCWLARTNPADVARVESKTFICTETREEAIPTPQDGVKGTLGNWISISDMEKAIKDRFPGCMKGRTMYIVPFSMGPVGSPLSKIGVEITDSAYVVASMRIMTRMGANVWEQLQKKEEFVRALHSVGTPINGIVECNSWPCDPERTIILHKPADNLIVSYGSGYGGNSLLGKKCFALRIGSTIAKKEGWLAEHMLILGITDPKGVKKYITAAFPSACGKTNLAMLNPTLPGYKVECVGDDIAWMKFDKNGTLRAINPENGFFGVAPGTSMETNPIAMNTVFKNTIFTNVASTSDGGVYWEGMESSLAEGVTVTDWLGNPWDKDSGKPAAHPNSRFCTPANQCPIIDSAWEDPAGVPISAILFGGRRPAGVPLIYEARNWTHGVFMGASMRSESTAAAEHKGKVIMHDPFAMRPFFGYNFGDYVQHWLSMEARGNAPKIFHVNWFRKGANGKFMWPGYGDNVRVLEWVLRRIDGDECAAESAIGYIPAQNELNLSGMPQKVDLAELFSLPKDFWNKEVEEIRKYFETQIGSDLPAEIYNELDELKQRVATISNGVSSMQNKLKQDSCGLYNHIRGINVSYGSVQRLTPKVHAFVEESVVLCQPEQIHICDGSDMEHKMLLKHMLEAGTIVPLPKYENCWLARTNPADVARVESKTFICTETREEAIPTPQDGVKGTLGNWISISDMEKAIKDRFPGCMKGRTMYIVPFSMGPVGSPLSKIGVEITDSAYVVASMRIMTRMGANVWEQLQKKEEFVRALHSVGTPINGIVECNSWPCDPERTIILHKPADNLIVSYGSGYGGNSLLGKKCFALRIGSTIAKKEGWLAEHMLILGITDPKGVKKYITAAFPSACGKTNLAMLNPTLPGYKVECVGDDIAWMKFDKNGTLRAINPENGFFGVAPGTSMETNPIAMNTVFKNTIFTNVASTSDGGVYWEGMESSLAEGVTVTDWLGNPWDKDSGKPAAHPNSRFCTPANQCPIIDSAWEDPAGVPISAILFGGRRPAGVPLIYEARNWTHGVFMGAAMRSESTAAAEHKGKVIMHDPFAMRPFFGYNFGDYVQHWLSMEARGNAPKIFHVNWFRKGANGKFMWPGYGDNVRVLEWVLRRIDGDECAAESAIGYIPAQNELNLSGMPQKVDLAELFSLPKDFWNKEVEEIRKYFETQIGSDLPAEIYNELDELKQRVATM